MKKRILSLLMVLCMLASLFPAGVMAEGAETEPPNLIESEEDAPIELPEEDPCEEAEAAMLPEERPGGEAALPEEPEPVAAQEELPEIVKEEDLTEPSQEAEQPPVDPAEPADKEDEASDEPEVLPVQVRFLVTPADAAVTVYTQNELDEKEALQPEEDGSWMLLPGEYSYSASAEGCEAVEGESFTVSEADQYAEIIIELIPAAEDDDEAVTIASVSGEACGPDLTWTLDDAGLLTISGTGEMYGYDKIYENGSYVTSAPWGTGIKTVVMEQGVTSIGNNAFRGCSDLTSVTLPNSVLNIGRHAFRDCSRLTSVTIPDGVTSIEYCAFGYCSRLTSMTIPESITSIGEWAFDECNSLTSVNIHDLAAWCRISFGNQEANPLYYAHSLYFDGAEVTDLVILSGVTSIGNYAFSGCNGLTIVTIPDSVTSIGMWAFEKCTSLQSVTIPDSVTSIGEGAFYGCSNLESVTIPDSVTSIGGWAFSDCTNLTSVTIPDGVTSIGVQTFYNCISLTSVTIPESVTSIGDDAFHDCSRLTSVMIPGSVTSIGNDAFSGCSSLKNVTIRNGVTSIGSGMFGWCSSLTSVTIPESVTSIGNNAFCECISLTSVNIHDLAAWCRISFGDDEANPLCFGGKLYLNGTEIKDMVIPSGVTSIGNGAFRGCSGLTSVTIPDSVTSIGDYAFYACNSLTSVTIPDSVTSIGDDAFCACNSLTSVTIPDSVTSIGDYAFYACNSLTSVTIPDSVTSIGDYAFCSCSSVTSVEIPDSVTSIGAEAFYGCYSLTSVTIGNGVESIGFQVFTECSSLTNVIIPDSVTSIGAEAFYGCCNLASVSIPDSVTSIGEYAFSDCSSLNTVYYTGSDQTWNAIEIEDGNDALLNATLVLVEPGWLDPPSALTFGREYLLLEKGAEPIELVLNVKNPTYLERVEWGTESGTEKVVSVENGVVTVRGTGTDCVVATYTDIEKTLTARCRIDVLDKEKQGAREITVSLPVTQVATEIYKTDYTRFDVILRLVQNTTASVVTAGNGAELEDTGVAITDAQFVGNSNLQKDIRPYFDLHVVDDRTLEIVPTVDLNDTAKIKTIAGNYKSAVRVWFSDGSYATTQELTVKVGKALPRLTAKAVTVNGFIAGQTVPVEITGGTVTSVTPQDLTFATLNADMTVTVKDGVTQSGKAAVTLACQPDDWAVPVTLKLTVNNQYKAPKVTLNPASVTLNPDVEDLATAKVAVTPLPGVKHEISAEGGSGLLAWFDKDAQAVRVQRGSAAAGTYKVPVKADGKQVALLTVKVLPGGSAVTLTAKAAGAIDTLVPMSPVVITVTGKNFNAEAGEYDVDILQTNKQLGIIDQRVNSLFRIESEGNVITVMGKDELKDYVTGYTYTAVVSCKAGTAKAVKMTVKTSSRAPARSVTLKAAGSIDALRPGTEIVLTPTFRNWFDYKETRFGLRFNNPNLDYRYKNGVFRVYARDGADLDLTLKQVWMTYEGKDVSNALNLSLKMGKAVITQSTKAITLSKSDRYDRQSVVLSLSDSSLYDIRNARVTMTDASGALRLIELGNGEYAIGYKDSQLPGNIAQLKSATAKLNVFLQGNDGTKPNATLGVKVSFV